MAAKKQTRTKKTSPSSPFKNAWDRFRRSRTGRALILLFLFAAVISFFAWITGTNQSLFLLLTGVLFLVTMAIAWFMYLTLRETSKPVTKPRTRKNAKA